MGLKVYILASVLSCFFKPGLRRYDRPEIPYRFIQDMAFGPLTFWEKDNLIHEAGMRRMLRGSLWQAIWLILVWLSPSIFFTGDIYHGGRL